MTRPFARWLRKSGLDMKALSAAVLEMSKGLIDADLGGGVLKKRIAIPGRGKRGGARTLVATNRADRWFFVFGFQKNERDNISDRELSALKLQAADLISLTPGQLALAIREAVLQEIVHDQESETR